MFKIRGCQHDSRHENGDRARNAKRVWTAAPPFAPSLTQRMVAHARQWQVRQVPLQVRRHGSGSGVSFAWIVGQTAIDDVGQTATDQSISLECTNTVVAGQSARQRFVK